MGGSDAVLDTCLAADPKSKVACETATKDNMVMVAGEITTQAKMDYDKTVRSVVANIGFDSYVDDLSSVDSKGLSDKTCEVLVRINKQSPDIAGGVHVGKEEMNKLITEKVVKKTLSEIKLKNGQPALSLFGDFTHMYINPSGKFIIGGPQGDAGLTGRKIIIDTYGGWGAHGGGAFSGK